MSRIGTAPGKRSLLLLVAGLALTAGWLGACAYYVATYVGWSDLLSLLPHELGGFVAGAFAPLAFLWFALVYLGTGAKLGRVGQAIESQRRQALELALSTHRAVGEADRIKEIFERQIRELSYPAGEMQAHRGARLVNNVKNDGPELIEPELAASAR